jgi:hypothetical protein
MPPRKVKKIARHFRSHSRLLAERISVCVLSAAKCNPSDLLKKLGSARSPLGVVPSGLLQVALEIASLVRCAPVGDAAFRLRGLDHISATASHQASFPCEGNLMLKRSLATFGGCLFLLSCLIGCGGSLDDQPEFRLTDPPAQEKLPH